MIIFDENYLDDIVAADLTASSASAFLPALNILSSNWSKPWRTDAGASHTLEFDFGSAQNYTGAAILLKATTAISSVVVEFSIDAISWTDSQTIISGAPSFGVGVKTFTQVSSKRYARITITLGSSGVADVFRAHVGTFWEPADKQRINYNFDAIERSELTQNEPGQYFSSTRPVNLRVAFETPPVIETERENWLLLIKDYGRYKNLFITFDDDYPQTQTLYGKFLQTGRHQLFLPTSGGTRLWFNSGWIFEGVREVDN